MARARREWSAIRDTDIRPLLRETTAAASYWSDAELLLYANLVQDEWAARMMQWGEGWWTVEKRTNLVAQQREYTLEEGTDKVVRIRLQFNEGGTTYDIPLQRLERWSETVVSGVGNVGATGTVPTYRFDGELIILEPAPTETRTNGLVIDVADVPARLTGDSSKFDLKWPAMWETLLVYEVVMLAMGVEDSQGNQDPALRGRLERMRDRMARAFENACRQRSYNRVFGTPHHLGD